jgi:hypothetical protein
MSVTYTASPAARSRSRSTGRFSSSLASTRSGASSTMRSTCGFLVPRIRSTSSPAGCVHQSVAATSTPGQVAATASVSDGTRDTTRCTTHGTRTAPPRSSVTTRSA